MAEPNSLLSLCPQYPDNPVMVMGWAGCLYWAIGDAQVREAFEQETGMRYSAPRTPLDAMIDAAAGYDVGPYVFAFAQWMTVNIWGDADSDAETDYALDEVHS